MENIYKVNEKFKVREENMCNEITKQKGKLTGGDGKNGDHGNL